MKRYLIIVLIFVLPFFNLACSQSYEAENCYFLKRLELNTRLDSFYVKNKKDSTEIALYYKNTNDVFNKKYLFVRLFCLKCLGYFYEKDLINFAFYDTAGTPMFNTVTTGQRCKKYKKNILNHPNLAEAYSYIFNEISGEKLYEYNSIIKESIKIHTDSTKIQGKTYYLWQIILAFELEEKINGINPLIIMKGLYSLSLKKPEKCSVCGSSSHLDELLKILGREEAIKDVKDALDEKD